MSSYKANPSSIDDLIRIYLHKSSNAVPTSPPNSHCNGSHINSKDSNNRVGKQIFNKYVKQNTYRPFEVNSSSDWKKIVLYKPKSQVLSKIFGTPRTPTRMRNSQTINDSPTGMKQKRSIKSEMRKKQDVRKLNLDVSFGAKPLIHLNAIENLICKRMREVHDIREIVIILTSVL